MGYNPSIITDVNILAQPISASVDNMLGERKKIKEEMHCSTCQVTWHIRRHNSKSTLAVQSLTLQLHAALVGRRLGCLNT